MKKKHYKKHLWLFTMERKPDFRFTRLSPIQTHNFPRLKIKVTAAQTPAPNKHEHTHFTSVSTPGLLVWTGRWSVCAAVYYHLIFRECSCILNASDNRKEARKYYQGKKKKKPTCFHGNYWVIKHTVPLTSSLDRNVERGVGKAMRKHVCYFWIREKIAQKW